MTIPMRSRLGVRRVPWPALLFVILALWVVFPAAVGGKILSANDVTLFFPPFEDQRPAGLDRPSNELLGDPVYVFIPISSERATP